MARKELTKNIADVDGREHVYTLTQHGAEEGWALFMELWETFGESVGQLFGSVAGVLDGGSIADANVDGELLGKALTSIAVRQRAAGGMALFKRLLKYTTRDEGFIDFDAHYQGNYNELIRAVAFAMEANFANFFGGSTGAQLVGKLRDRATAHAAAKRRESSGVSLKTPT